MNGVPGVLQRFSLEGRVAVVTGGPDRVSDRCIKAYAQRTPLRRMATDGNPAGPPLLLATDAGSYLTGQTLVVDGGFTL